MKKFISIFICISLFISTFMLNEKAIANTSKDLEKPIEFNSATLFWEQHSSYDKQAEIKRQDVLNTQSVVKPTQSTNNTTFYISPSGNDSNDGRSPESAWRTTDNLWNYSWFNYGDVVLFERGSVYRNSHFVLMNGLSYGAYGEGPKPALYGSAYNYAKDSFWSATTNENIWKIKLNSEITNIGNIVFDYGKFCGYYRQENSLTKDFDFWEDKENNSLYLYFSKGNPGEYFEDIEICDGRNILSAGPNSNIKVDNLCLRYTGAHGMSFSIGGENVTVTNCEVGYIGGSQLIGFQNFVRYGNGIEFYGTSNNSLVDNCWVYQCYDAGLTCQGSNSIISNLTFKNNLVEYCQYDIEIWVGDETLKYSGYSEADNSKLVNCVFENNILRFAGYNFQYDNRLGSNTSAAACISSYDFCVPCDEKTVIRNNVFDTSYRYLLSLIKPNTINGPKVTDNIWITNAFSSDEKNVLGNIPTVACVGQTRNNNDRKYYYAGSHSAMETSVTQFDLNPKEIVYDGDKYENCHNISDWTVKEQGTCTKDGVEIKYCTYCEEVFETRPIKSKNHNIVIDNAVKPDCFNSGLTQGSHCLECKEIFVEQTIVPITEHSLVTKNAVSKNYFTKGYTGDTVCILCNSITAKGKSLEKLKLKRPAIKLSSKKKQITVKFAKITGAKKYEVLIKNGNKWKKYTTKKTKYTFKKLKKGKIYSVKVRAVVTKSSKKAYSSYSKIKKLKVK